jgi:hypothetical protein
MSLRDHLIDLLGAEIQAHTVKLGRRQQVLHFRQLTDAEGRAIFKPVDGESDADRGRRTMRALVQASLCTPDGEPVSTVDEVAKLSDAALQALFGAAAETNNLSFAPVDDEPAVEGEPSPKG